MINYRNIFNPTYSYIGIMVIIAIAILILISEKNILLSIYQISRTSLISGTISLIIGILINFLIQFIITNPYKIFITIITRNLIKNLYFYSAIIIIISGILNLITRIFVNLDSKSNRIW